MNTTKREEIDATALEKAKHTALELTQDYAPTNIESVFDEQNLDAVESIIKNLNDYSSKCWILSALAVYTLVYDKNLYTQSGLTWSEYIQQSKERLGLDKRELSEQLSSARFFIKNKNALIRYGWTTSTCKQSLARGELAYELSGDIDETCKHIAQDSWANFRDWYQSFDLKKAIPEPKNTSYTIKNRKAYYNDIEAVKVSDELPEDEQSRFVGYIEQIFDALAQGYEPAIVPVYDKKEANKMLRLRDKSRRGEC